MKKVVKRPPSKKQSADSKAEWNTAINVTGGPLAGTELVSKARIITLGDTSAPPMLRHMAWQLTESLRELGHEPENEKTYHLVEWPAFGIAIAIYGNPKKDEEWREAVDQGFGMALVAASWPIHEEDDDEADEHLARMSRQFGGRHVH